MLDRLSPQLRHLALLLLAALLGALATNLPAYHLPPTLAPLVGALLAAALAWVTPLVRTYGVGSPREGEDEGL